MARVSVCQSSLSIASLGSFVGYDRLLPALGYLLFFLLGIHEFVATRTARIKPLHERFVPSIWLFRQDHDGVSGWPASFGSNGLKSRIQASAFRIEDTNQVQVVWVRQFEHVGPGRQNLPRNFYRLAERDFDGLVRFIGMSNNFQE